VSIDYTEFHAHLLKEFPLGTRRPLIAFNQTCNKFFKKRGKRADMLKQDGLNFLYINGLTPPHWPDIDPACYRRRVRPG
jgi:hypothetical protein